MDDHTNGLTSYSHQLPAPSALPPASTTDGELTNAPPSLTLPSTANALPEQSQPHKKRRGRPSRTNQEDVADGRSVRRGRPPGSRNKVSRATTGVHPHVLHINSGEDVVGKLRSFSTTYKRSLCVLAASGSLSSATLMQVGQGGQGVGVTLTGQFTVLSISGAVLHEHGDPSTGEPKVFLSASLANPTGGVVGGTVAGPMEAHGSAMVVVGHWAPPDTTRSLSMTLSLCSNGVNDGPSSPMQVQADPRFSGTAMTPSASPSVPVLSHSVLSPPTTIPAFSLPQPVFPSPMVVSHPDQPMGQMPCTMPDSGVMSAPVPPAEADSAPGPETLLSSSGIAHESVPILPSAVEAGTTLPVSPTQLEGQHDVLAEGTCHLPINGDVKMEIDCNTEQKLPMGPQ